MKQEIIDCSDHGGACDLDLDVCIVECTDSDGGDNIEIKGTTTGAYYGELAEKTDHCYTFSGLMYIKTYLVEYTCLEDGITITSDQVECPKNHYCDDGMCIKIECEDPDGKNIYQKATSSGVYDGFTLLPDFGGDQDKGDTVEDSCWGENYVIEYYCDKDGSTLIEDYINCPDGYKCADGRCVSTAECTDSDEENNPYKKGYVAYVDSKTYKPKLIADKCYTNNLNKLKEAKCINNQGIWVVEECKEDENCYDGVCEKTCFDSDGFNTEGKGFIEYLFMNPETNKLEKYKEWDDCEEFKTLKEWICDPVNGAVIAEVDCNEYGAVCVGKKCQEAVCKDFDNNNPYESSSVGYVNTETDGWDYESDECETDTKVKERLCTQDNMPTYTYYNCPSGYKCEGGACKSI